MFTEYAYKFSIYAGISASIYFLFVLIKLATKGIFTSLKALLNPKFQNNGLPLQTKTNSFFKNNLFWSIAFFIFTAGFAIFYEAKNGTEIHDDAVKFVRKFSCDNQLGWNDCDKSTKPIKTVDTTQKKKEKNTSKLALSEAKTSTAKSSSEIKKSSSASSKSKANKKYGPDGREITYIDYKKTKETTKHLILGIQEELAKKRCYYAYVDGKWGKNSQMAFDEYAKKIYRRKNVLYEFRDDEKVLQNALNGFRKHSFLCDSPENIYYMSQSYSCWTRGHKFVLSIEEGLFTFKDGNTVFDFSNGGHSKETEYKGSSIEYKTYRQYKNNIREFNAVVVRGSRRTRKHFQLRIGEVRDYFFATLGEKQAFSDDDFEEESFKCSYID